MGGFEVKSNIALTVVVCIASFEAIGEVEHVGNSSQRGAFVVRCCASRTDSTPAILKAHVERDGVSSMNVLPLYVWLFP